MKTENTLTTRNNTTHVPAVQDTRKQAKHVSKQSWHNVERDAYMLPYQVRQCSIGMKPSPVRAASIDSRLYISPVSNLRLIDGVMVIM